MRPHPAKLAKRGSSWFPSLDLLPSLHPLDLRRHWPHCVAVWGALFALYLCTTPRTVTLEDSGIFILSCWFAGISHPPGYPLHSLLGKLFTLLPVGTPAFRVHLLSAFFGAGTCAALWAAVQMLFASKPAAYLAALGYGLSRTFWSQAIVAEVYTLNTFFFFALFAAGLWFLKRDDKRGAILLGTLLGLGLSHHWPLMVLSLPCVALLLWPARGRLRNGWAVLAFSLAVTIPYFYLVLRSNMNPPISFYGPIDSFGRFLFFVTRRGYATVESSPSADWRDKLLFLGFLGGEVAIQYSFFGAALAGVGFVLQWKRWPMGFSTALCLGFLGSSAILAMLLDFDYQHLQRAVFCVYPLIPYGVMAIWLALGFQEVTDFLGRRSARIGRIARVVIPAVVVLATGTTHWRQNNRRDYTWAHEFGKVVLDSLEPKAVLFTTGDSDTGPIGYLHYVMGMRQDVEVYNDQGLVFANRIFRPPVSRYARSAAIADFIRRTTRPVYYTGQLDHPYGVTDFGIFRKVEKSSPKDHISFAITSPLAAYYRKVVSQANHTDPWTVDHRNILMAKFAGVLAPLAHLEQDPMRRRELEELLSLGSRHYHSRLMMIEAMMKRLPSTTLLEWAEEAERLLDHTASKEAHSRLDYLRGHIFFREGKVEDAIGAFERSLAIYPHPNNGSALNLVQIHLMRKNHIGAAQLMQRYGVAVPPAESSPAHRAK